MAALAIPATSHGVTVGPACQDSRAPVLCAIKVQHRRWNAWRVRYGDGRAALSGDVLAYPHRRPFYLWRESERRESARARYRALWSWYYASGAACVHAREGSWTDPDAPYWGGFQMSLSFQSSHGPRYLQRYGTADHWSPTIQIRVTRSVAVPYGWGQWPNTGAACGLL